MYTIIFIILVSISIIIGLIWANNEGDLDWAHALGVYIPFAMLGCFVVYYIIFWIWEKTNSEFSEIIGLISIILMVGFVARIVMADHKKD
tara:strand:- start:146 stop:415 length:270 start_codon:yes stop_codon:yes gene_type:complete